MCLFPTDGGCYHVHLSLIREEQCHASLLSMHRLLHSVHMPRALSQEKLSI